MTKKRPVFREQIRAAIERCGLTRYEIHKQTGLDQALLSKFMHGSTGLSMDALDKLAECIGLVVRLDKPTKRKG